MDQLTSFDSLDLPPPIRKALAHSNISVPTPIQAQAIPHALLGKDIIGLAQTGTGKTLTFCLPLVTQMDKAGDQDECALILAPTREIAIQVTEVLKHLTLKMTGRWHPVLVIGGVGMQPQVDGLKKKPRFIIATPGRLVDHMEEGFKGLESVKYLVLDEADRMLDMGFAPQLNKILKGVPSERQTMLFSATFPNEIADISQKYLKDPIRVEAGPGHSVPIDTIKQETRELEEDAKFDTLLDLIKTTEGTMIVFTRTKYRTEKLARNLEKNGISAGRMHGDRSQSQRQTTLKAFRDGDIRILVATDIAARGIDVPEVGHVINYDIPHVPEEYIHRIGRTGRAGAEGHAISFITPEVREEWRAILKLIDPELYAKTPHVPNVIREPKPQNGRRPHRNDRGHNGAPNRREERRPHRQERFEQRAAPQGFANHSDFEDEDGPSHQPSLEEQMTRIDKAAPRQNFRRGPGGHGANNRRPGQGGPGGRPQNNRGGGRPPHRRGSDRPRPQSAQPQAQFRDDDEDNIGNKF